MAGMDEVQLRAEDDYAFEGDIADDSMFLSCGEILSWLGSSWFLFL